MSGGADPSFFGQGDLDRSLPAANALFWEALVEKLGESLTEEPELILDVGCHSGGLLALLAKRYPAAELVGIEPVAALRGDANARLSGRARLLSPAGWSSVQSGTVSLIVCHEVLYLISDLASTIGEFRRVCSAAGEAWIVLGCHSENPVWPAWKRRLEDDGIRTYDHSPLDLLRAARRAGFACELQPLRTSGWIRYDPDDAPFAFPSAAMMIDHHYRHKLLFRLSPDDQTAPA